MINNKYKKIYDSLMFKRQKIDPIFKDQQYCESHHIKPKFMGGNNEQSNLVNLTPREHFIAHKLLTKFTKGKQKRSAFWAFHRLTTSKNSNFKLNSRKYEKFRVAWSKFLIDNHPSKTSDKWTINLKKSVFESWKNADERRKAFSIMFSQSHSKRKKDDPQKYKEIQTRNAKLGGIAAKEKNSKRIEYKGKIFKGWKNFSRQTGISKFAYLKYYKNGIDPFFRIKKNGPLTEEEVKKMILQFSETKNDKDTQSILTEMKTLGLLTSKQIKRYIEHNG